MAVTFIALFGLAFGSFINVLIARLPESRPLSGRSHCESCNQVIPFYENIPIYSYLKLNGKCSKCKATIGLTHLLVEISTPILLILGYLLTQNTFEFALWITLILLGTPLAIIDFRTRRLPNSLNYLFALLVLFILVSESLINKESMQLRNALLQGFSLSGFYLLIRLLSRGGMGMGDIKLAFPLGLISGYLGKYLIFISSYAAFLLGTAVAIWFLVFKKASRKQAIPFGPFLIFGFAMSYLYILSK